MAPSKSEDMAFAQSIGILRGEKGRVSSRCRRCPEHGQRGFRRQASMSTSTSNSPNLTDTPPGASTPANGHARDAASVKSENLQSPLKALTHSVGTPQQLYNIAAYNGTKLAKKPVWKTLVQSIAGGVYLGLGALLALSVGANTPAIAMANPGLQALLFGAFGLPLGLFLILLTGSELYTGNTMTVGVAYFEGQIRRLDFARNLLLSWAGNLMGTLLLVSLVYATGAAPVASAVAVAEAKMTMSISHAFFRGVLCNILVTTAIFVASGASDLSGKMIAVWFPISAFLAMKFEQSVANMFMIPLGMSLGAPVTVPQFFLRNLLPVTFGNFVGGCCIVALFFAVVYGSGFNKKS